MDNLAIIYTTFLRNKLMEETIISIVDNWQDNYIIFNGNQNKENMNPKLFHDLYSKIPGKILHYNLPYDCGLSYARNFLVLKAYEKKIPYCLISADSIEFTDKYNLQPIIDFIKYKNDNAVVGLKLANRQPFEYDMNINREIGKFILSRPNRAKTIYQGINYQRCDIVKNFFVAPTELLYKWCWHNDLKLAEHETFFNQLKEQNVEVYYTEKISANYIDNKPDEYKVMRDRLYSEFLAKMCEINNMPMNREGWIEYPRT